MNKNFPDRTILKDFSYSFQRGERIGIIGKNGTGKSTLLRILSGILQSSLGKVVTERDLRIGYLEQDPQFSNQETISDFIYSIGNERQQLIRQYEEAVNQDRATIAIRLHEAGHSNLVHLLGD